MFLKLKDAGWYCIPVIQKTKKPALVLDFLNGFTGISYDGIPEEVLEEWDEKYPVGDKYGIALVLGKINNVSAVDIDSDDRKILDQIPNSPLIKMGNRERIGTYFYQHNEHLPAKLTFGDSTKNDSVDFLNGHNITILPPTIHKSGERYMWLSPDDLFSISASELPLITGDHLKSIDKLYEKKFGSKYSLVFGVDDNISGVSLEGTFNSTVENGKERCAHGAQNRLKKFAAVLLGKNTPIDAAAAELVKYDKEHHLGISYFEDQGRGKDSSADPYANALRFYSSVAHQVNTMRIKRGEAPHDISPLTASNNKKIEVEQKKELSKIKLPEPRGRLKAFIDCANKYSFNDNTDIGFAYGLAYLSMHLANRYAVKYKGTYWPANLMIFVVASSGMGKNKPRKFMEQLLYDAKCLGSSEYTSPIALLQEFTSQYKTNKKGEKELLRKGRRELLASIDEVDGLLTTLAKSKEAFEARFKKVLIELFDASRDQFFGQFSKMGGVEGKVCNPYFSLIGSTQPTYFKKALQGDILYKGIYQRALIFELKSISDPDITKEPDLDMEQKLQNFTRLWFNTHFVDIQSFDTQVVEGKENEVPVHYKEIRLSPEAEDYLRNLDLEFFNSRRLSHNAGNDLKTSIKARFIDNTLKLAQIDWISSMPKTYIDNPSLYPLGVEHLEWAKQVVLAKYEEAKEYFDQQVVNSNKDEQDMETIVGFIKKKGGKVALEDITRGTRVGLKARRDMLIKELQERCVLNVIKGNEIPKPITYLKLL
jgi:hypothetical protein